MLQKRKTLKQYAARLDDTPWLTVSRYAWGAFSVIAIAALVAPAAWRPTVKMLGLAMPLLFFAAKDVAQLPRVLVLMRDLRWQRAGALRYVSACFPPALIGLARVDRELWRGFFGWVRRQPAAARPAGVKLSVDERSAYSTVVALGLLSTLVELPIDAAILPLLIADPVAVKTIHLAAVLSAAYGVVWLLGDRWLVRSGYHVLTDTHLDLQVGARAKALIPLTAIEDISLLRESMDEWRAKRSLGHADTVNVTPFDKPNIVLCLAPEAGCVITHHGLARNEARYIFLYLDHPGKLIAALAPMP
ncbi:hypothetical protein [Massilia sp. Root335]|jgi:hypothetical protein|uniref:hypothetical protein n=1 Tax=Massilia sp. Root335 TaxID=1736517 RepID=UPI0006FFE942|nr:hypothetical protein [Massilia sp. Root335]KQV37119.1 hypothetical protein ASC93_20880 [Massilia sp. Root335]